MHGSNTALEMQNLIRPQKITEAFHGVEARGDMAPKIGDNSLRNHEQSTEEQEGIATTTIHFLGSKSDI